MDKKEVRLIVKKCSLFFILFIFLVLICGCQTMKGAAEGAKKDWQALQKTGENIKKADDKMQEVLW